MIREIGVELQAELKAQGVPFVVIDGPEASRTTTWGRERIVVEYDADKTDTFGPPRSQSINPKRRHSSLEACKITIYAQASAAGSLVAEHRRRAKTVRDKVICALDLIAARRKNAWSPGAGRLFTPEDLKDTERANGAAYELLFTWERAIEQRTWGGAKRPEGNITGIGSTTEVHGPGGEGAGETACGA